MKNEVKLTIFIFMILTVAFGFSKFFGLSLNTETFQIGYTVYDDKGQKVSGYIPQQKRSDGMCTSSCASAPENFAVQCRDKGYKVFAGPCCQTLCSGNVASAEGSLGL